MNVVFQALVVIVLAIITWQDFKMRAIHIGLPIALGIIGILNFYKKGYHTSILLYNIIFLGLTFTGLYMYMMIKNKKWNYNLSEVIGLGDILFFMSVLPYFSTYNYILFFITGMVFSILGFLLLKFLVQTELVPLAGLLAIYMMLLLMIDQWFNYDLVHFNSHL
ncbi:hypothetical protein NBT05_17305 [Aquimarina sp. ERC-38]|uniref:hypothetical protein n=1 Tax=Aquimarina sp. ERC-38 TaxID=2949996 RepID=UPI00224777CA|nr:hypothetical protein [Aquimarina sp. ERC-38]UZO80686.1 hypothetical protein NBT05_17305 [Aquimarina sp. ERC-38]